MAINIKTENILSLSRLACSIPYRIVCLASLSPPQYLAAVEKKERLENQLIQTQIAQQESLRKILSLTGFDLPIPNPQSKIESFTGFSSSPHQLSEEKLKR